MANKTLIKFNGGNPVSLCKKCSTITAYVKFDETNGVYLTVDGLEPKLHCLRCEDLLASKKVRRTIKTSTTNEHLEVSLNLLNQYLKMFSNEKRYTDLLALLTDKKASINE
jgi:hypothetical protein